MRNFHLFKKACVPQSRGELAVWSQRIDEVMANFGTHTELKRFMRYSLIAVIHS
jgi:hypothetical protein